MNSLSFGIPGTGWISPLSSWRKWGQIKYGLPASTVCAGNSHCCGLKANPWLLIAPESV